MMILDDIAVYNYALIQAVVHGDIDIVRFCLERGADVNTTDANGNTPLVLASRARYALTPKLVAQLLAHQANVDHHNDDNATAAHMASMAGNLEVLGLLREAGARLGMQDAKLRTPLHLATAHNQPAIAEFLLFSGVPVDVADEDGNTPLLTATANRNIRNVTLLLHHRANMSHKNRKNQSAVSIAWQNRDQELLRLFHGHSTQLA
jgi:ankyrin repeat protein